MNLPPQARILIVDDDASSIELIANCLRDDGYDIRFAMSGERALELVAAARPDLILLDVMLPGISGFEVCGQLKSDARTELVPILFITGQGDARAETRGLELGALDYIAKPFNPVAVRVRVRNHINLKQAQDALACLATTDRLTGLANRFSLDHALERAHAERARAGASLALLMMDIDHFKSFNDTHGHLRGDECLRKVSETIATSLTRQTDRAYRYGGEEFVCVLSADTDAEGARLVAERTRRAVESLGIAHPAAPTGCVTLSVGALLARCDPSTPPSALLAHADAQLYRAKHAGRNRTRFAIWPYP